MLSERVRHSLGRGTTDLAKAVRLHPEIKRELLIENAWSVVCALSYVLAWIVIDIVAFGGNTIQVRG